MKICPNCGSQIPDGAYYCTNCGAKTNEMVTCPNCGKFVVSGTKFCMYCGSSITGESTNGNASLQQPQAPMQPMPPKKKMGAGTIALCVLGFLLAVAAVAGYFYMSYTKEQERLRMEQEAREQAIEDSLEQVRFEEQTKAEEAKKAEEQRIEDVSVFVRSMYSYRGEYRNKIVKFYSSDLKSAYKSWHTDDEFLIGPQALFFDKKWDEGCGTWVIVRNFKTEIVEASSPDENTAIVEVNVTFALYSAYEDEDFMQNDSHKDVLHLKYEGEWKIDDLVRDGKSVKAAYRAGSSAYGREEC